MPKSRKSTCATEHSTREVPVQESVGSTGQNMEKILRMLIDDWRQREIEFAEERRRWEEELAAEQEWHEKRGGSKDG